MDARRSIPAIQQSTRTDSAHRDGATHDGSAGDDAHMQEAAKKRVMENLSLRRFSAEVQIQCHTGTVRLTGRLPSFYLKQMLQTTLRNLPGCDRIENEVEVGPQGER